MIFRVYGVRSRGGLYHYVGCTSYALKDRLKGLIREKRVTLKRPEIVNIETATTERRASRLEQRWIAKLRKEGHPLTNCPDARRGIYHADHPKPLATQVRMEPALKKRIRKYQAKMAKRNVELTFGDAARILLKTALDAEGIR